MTLVPTPIPDDIDALRAALAAERTARHAAEVRATGAEAMIAHLELLIAKLQRDRFDPTYERSRRLLDQLELQLKELEALACTWRKFRLWRRHQGAGVPVSAAADAGHRRNSG
jgi:hypothetical protein